MTTEREELDLDTLRERTVEALVILLGALISAAVAEKLANCRGARLGQYGRCKMNKIKVYIGSVTAGSGGQTNDNTRPVEFVGEELANRTEYEINDRGGVGDTRGVTERLFRTEDGRLLVHVEDWSRWQGEPTSYRLREVTEEDLGIGGRFEMLGREAGMGRPLTVDEALEV